MPQTTTDYRPTPTNPNNPSATQPPSSATQAADEFLDEVDSVLEENVDRSYIQPGGQ